jgi:hypothetical protein
LQTLGVVVKCGAKKVDCSNPKIVSGQSALITAILMDAKHQIAPPNNKPPEHKQRRRRRTSSSTTQQSPRRVTTQSNGYHSSLIGWSTKSTQFRLHSPNEPEHHKASDSNHSTCRRRIQEAELKRWTTRNGRRWTDKKKEVYWKYTTQPTMTTPQHRGQPHPPCPCPHEIPSLYPPPKKPRSGISTTRAYETSAGPKSKVRSYLPTNQQPLCSPTRTDMSTNTNQSPSPHQPSPTAPSYTPSPPPLFAKNPSTS